jgi:hypothetical protein
MKINRVESWAFKVFCLSTIFITIFSVQAIYNWPPLAEKLSIFLACALPAGIIILGRAGIWLKTRQIPKEFIWVLLISIFGLLSCLQSENQEASLKSMGLFIASGPLVFFVANNLFKPKKNKESYLWMTSLSLLGLAFWGIYEHFSLGIVYLFSRNPLPAGTLLILLSIGPLILLNRPYMMLAKCTLALIIFSSMFLIILMAKKSHLLGLMVFFITLMIFNFRKYYKFFMGLILLIVIALFSSDSLRLKNENLINLFSQLTALSSANSEVLNHKLPLAIYGSIPLRVENYFFGLHVIKKNPTWGLGFKAKLDSYFADYNIRLVKFFSKEHYQEYIQSQNAFENIILTYLIEWGAIFCLIYFGGIAYIAILHFKESKIPLIKEMDCIFVVAIIISFSAMSLTFDTLRFPSINWVFHTLLGLLVNIPEKYQVE